ncbi:hypothetical protein IAD21_05644 [Abditibacteriota bacterium]|nr:hypothetical protein IAD21_05644 [Abditibacteriota bacterium]
MFSSKFYRRFEQTSYFLIAAFLGVGLCARMKTSASNPDEVRVFRVVEDGNLDAPSQSILVHLKGVDARRAYDNFVVEKSSFCNLCLNPAFENFVHIEFYSKGMLS